MPLKKTDLYSSLWKGADELRGGMDASQYKDYVLTLLFVKYVSDKAKVDKDSLIEVPKGGSFDDLVSFKNDKEIGDKINKAIAKLAEANDLQHVINQADFNDEEKLGKGKEMQDRLTNLISIFQDLDFRGSRAEGDDLLGDAYEYLMRHFATESGKSKGQFYTPAEVSRIMAQMIGIKPNTPKSATVYDPTCGSGSLLLKVADFAPNGLTIYGQEKDNATWALAKMNMILHGNEIADIRKGDTITSPQFTNGDKLETFDFLVANPPFSTKSWSNGLENEYGRFDGYGRPPQKNGDFAFLLHMIKSLKSNGKAAVIVPHGVLFRGNTEGQIRREIIKRGYIKGIIGLPANLFYGTGIPACILILDKEDAASRDGIFMIDASRGFAKDGPKNRLRARDMHKIVDAFAKQLEWPRYCRFVPMSEIESAANDFNLNLSRYIDTSEPEDIQDLRGHLQGGIPERDIEALESYWEAFPTLRNKLLRELRDGYFEFTIPRHEISAIVLATPELMTVTAEFDNLISQWWSSHTSTLEQISSTTKPAELITELSESLLQTANKQTLVEGYAIYEQLMTYWSEVMHDDVSLIMSEGWASAARPRKAIEDKERKLSETPDLTLGSGKSASKYKMDLLPPDIIKWRFFGAEAAKLDEKLAELDAVSADLAAFIEENSGEDSPISEAFDGDKTSRTLVAKALKTARDRKADSEEIAALRELADKFEQDAQLKSTIKEAARSLDERVLAQYSKLDEPEVRELVLTDKWLRALNSAWNSDFQKVIRQFSDRLSQLDDRYALPMPALEHRVQDLMGIVSAHLAAMGVVE